MKCPHCDKQVSYLYKCDTCAHVVCTSGNCKGGKGGGRNTGSMCIDLPKGKARITPPK